MAELYSTASKPSAKAVLPWPDQGGVRSCRDGIWVDWSRSMGLGWQRDSGHGCSPASRIPLRLMRWFGAPLPGPTLWLLCFPAPEQPARYSDLDAAGGQARRVRPRASPRGPLLREHLQLLRQELREAADHLPEGTLALDVSTRVMFIFKMFSP